MIGRVLLTVVTTVVSTVAAAVVVERFIKQKNKSDMAGEAPYQNEEDPILKAYQRL